LKANTTLNYIFRGQQDQQLRAFFPGDQGVLLTVLGPDGTPLNRQATRVQQWQGRLPYDGEYTVQVTPVPGLQQTDYSLVLGLSDQRQPSPSPTGEFDAERVTLAPGDSLQLVGQTSPQKIKRYLVNAQQGQQLTVEIPQGSNASLDIRGPAGRLLESGVKYWQGTLPRNGEYRIDVVAQQQENYTVNMGLAAGNNP